MNHTLTLLSSFSNILKLVSVKPYPLNDQFSFEPVSSEMLLLPNERVQVCAVNTQLNAIQPCWQVILVNFGASSLQPTPSLQWSRCFVPNHASVGMLNYLQYCPESYMYARLPIHPARKK